MSICEFCIHRKVCEHLWKYGGRETCIYYEGEPQYFKMPPCKIGDFVWAIRNYQGVLHAQQGKVTEMSFTKDMRLIIVVSHIARGQWGEKVFATLEDAEAKIAELQD